MNKEKKAFTFIELIISIIILSILSVLWFISYSKNQEDARDSKRKSDLVLIKESLKLEKSKRWTYPRPEGYMTWDLFKIYNNNYEVALQWRLRKSVILSSLSDVPYDPYIKVPYYYSVSRNEQEFELSLSLENNWANLALLDWDYKSVSQYILPSIIFATQSSYLEINNEENRKKFILNNQVYNIPYNFIKPFFPVSKNKKNLEVYMYDSDYKTKNDYKNCNEIIEDWKFIWYWEYEINQYWKIITTTCDNTEYKSSCKDILNSWLSNWDWKYSIIPKNWSYPVEVYCDMTTAWWGWTLMAKDWIYNKYSIWHCDFESPIATKLKEASYKYWACDLWQKEILFWTPSWWLVWTYKDDNSCSIDVTKTNNNTCKEESWTYNSFKVSQMWACVWTWTMNYPIKLSLWWDWNKNLSDITQAQTWDCDSDNKFCNLFLILDENNRWIWKTLDYDSFNCNPSWSDNVHLIYVR